jgi:hypothetical protein
VIDMDSWEQFVEAVEEGYDHVFDQVYSELEEGLNSAAAEGFQSLIENQRYSGARSYLETMESKYDIGIDLDLSAEV